MVRPGKIKMLPDNFNSEKASSPGINEPIAEIVRKHERGLVETYEGEIIPSIHSLYREDIIPRVIRETLDNVESLKDDAGAKTVIEQLMNYQKARSIVLRSFFKKSLEGFPLRDKVFQIARENSSGSRTAIVGGFVYSGIARILYNKIPAPSRTDKIDIDVVIEEKIGNGDRLRIPRGWRVTQTKYGVSLRKDNVNVDLNYLEGFHALQQRTNPKLEDIFPLTPLNVQAIFYDINNEILVGELGMEAIENRVVRVNNLFEAQRLAEIIKKQSGRSYTIDDLVRDKAKRLNFSYEL